jgi:beta-glucosidase/6-phospho-beta-glucosidase/beta-galactosidase
MERNGIEPNATLHHFTHPQWFEDLGGFEKEENIPLFVEWSVKAVQLFGDRITFWSTFNEPTVSRG